MKGLTIIAIIVMMIICLAFSALIILGSQLSIRQFVGNSSESGRKIANSMLDYTLPTGYLEQGGRDIGILKMAMITNDSQDPEFQARNLILLTTLPSILNLSEDHYRQELRLALLRSTEDVTTLSYVETQELTIRGEQMMFEVYESFGDYDTPTRILISPSFPGKSEDIIILFAGPIASWDQKMVRGFIKSIQ